MAEPGVETGGGMPHPWAELAGAQSLSDIVDWVSKDVFLQHQHQPHAQHQYQPSAGTSDDGLGELSLDDILNEEAIESVPVLFLSHYRSDLIYLTIGRLTRYYPTHCRCHFHWA